MKTRILYLPAIALISLAFSACNADDNKQEDNTTDTQYVYPAKTVPVTPEKTQTRQDNTDLDKTYRLDSTAVEQEGQLNWALPIIAPRDGTRIRKKLSSGVKSAELKKEALHYSR